MTTLVVGATGATGAQLVEQLLSMGQKVKIITRPSGNFLRVNVGQNNKLIDWVIVRPYALINEDVVSEYEIYASPIRSALLNPGRTSRINVGNFMSRLIVENNLWDKWKGQMPVIYNKET